MSARSLFFVFAVAACATWVGCGRHGAVPLRQQGARDDGKSYAAHAVPPKPLDSLPELFDPSGKHIGKVKYVSAALGRADSELPCDVWDRDTGLYRGAHNDCSAWLSIGEQATTSPDGRYRIATEDSQTFVVDMRTGAEVLALSQPPIACADYIVWNRRHPKLVLVCGQRLVAVDVLRREILDEATLPEGMELGAAYYAEALHGRVSVLLESEDETDALETTFSWRPGEPFRPPVEPTRSSGEQRTCRGPDPIFGTTWCRVVNNGGLEVSTQRASADGPTDPFDYSELASPPESTLRTDAAAEGVYFVVTQHFPSSYAHFAVERIDLNTARTGAWFLDWATRDGSEPALILPSGRGVVAADSERGGDDQVTLEIAIALHGRDTVRHSFPLAEGDWPSGTVATEDESLVAIDTERDVYLIPTDGSDPTVWRGARAPIASRRGSLIAAAVGGAVAVRDQSRLLWAGSPGDRAVCFPSDDELVIAREGATLAVNARRGTVRPLAAIPAAGPPPPSAKGNPPFLAELGDGDEIWITRRSDGARLRFGDDHWYPAGRDWESAREGYAFRLEDGDFLSSTLVPWSDIEEQFRVPGLFQRFLRGEPLPPRPLPVLRRPTKTQAARPTTRP
jgi:hypothetical protein